MDKYQEGEVIGQGTYGVVSKAFDTKNKIYVALKRMRLESEEEGIPSTAIREISLLNRLKHKNIMELFEVIHGEKELILVFELMDTDLKKFMDKLRDQNRRGIEPDLVKYFMKQLLEGIKHCHREGVIHRDLKPQNLLISNDNKLKIADFGLARAYGIPVRNYTNEVVTLWYRPPDVLLGQTKYSTPVDMWSVGCIFAEMYTGTALFKGENDESQLGVIFSKMGVPTEASLPGFTGLSEWKDEYYRIPRTPPSVSEVVNGLDYAGKNLLNRLLSYDPKKRLSARRSLKHAYFEGKPTQGRMPVPVPIQKKEHQVEQRI